MSLKEEECFLQMLTHGNNKKQQIYLLKYKNKDQYLVLKRIALDILNNIISLTPQEFNKLLYYKNFIRCLGREKIRNNILARNYKVVPELIKITLKHNEIQSKTSLSSNSRMGKSQRQKIYREKSDSDSELIESISTESNISSENSESKSYESNEAEGYGSDREQYTENIKSL